MREADVVLPQSEEKVASAPQAGTVGRRPCLCLIQPDPNIPIIKLMQLRIFAALFLASSFLTGGAQAFDHSHSALTGILKKVVSNKLVDYEFLKEEPAALDTYLGTLAAVSKSEFDSWSEDKQLAFLINLYNAATLDLIADNYPVASIKKIGNLFKGPWKQEVVDLFGEKTTLDHVEHGIIRQQYDDPRVHFALVCAALGCPPLREEAYTAAKLDAQLEDQGRIFLNNSEKNRVDAEAGVLYLSPIFDWFVGDFTKGGKSVAEWVAPYFGSKSDSAAAAGGKVTVKYTDYDWSLNDR